jgi:RNA polymerase sigma-70 factor, ECF subfamily
VLADFFIQILHDRCLFIETAVKLAGKRVNDSELNHWCKALYENKAAGLVLYGRALGLSHSEAEDVLQETFLALLNLPQEPAQPERYCLRAFRNRAVNFRRSLWRRLARELESKLWFEVSSDTNENEIVAMRCLEKLPAEQREVIVLKIWHGFTFEEIGEVLEVSPNTVSGRYRYGISKLKNYLKGIDYERSGYMGETVAILESAPALG